MTKEFGKNMKIYIWGCGINGKRLYRILSMAGITPDAFIDSDR